MTKAPEWSLDDLVLIRSLYKRSGSDKVSQKRMNEILIADRKARGTWKGEKNLSWQISRLSPRSKHYITNTSKIQDKAAYTSITLHISKCLHCSPRRASGIYTNRIMISGIAPADFFDPNQTNLVSIRYYFSKCRAPLYVAFTSVDYDFMDDDEPDYEFDEKTGELVEVPKTPAPDRIWTVKTPYTYNGVLSGSVTKNTLQEYLVRMANKEYEPIFLNTLVHRKGLRF